jgi:O-acetyl-ADP-ribose deacetylase (regulator of RNase III)
MKPEDFNLILVNPHTPLCDAWRAAFGKHPEVEIRQCRFEDLESFDCMVSAANSFGLMDGGVDLAITQYFGKPLMRRVQKRILAEFRGEQPVGTSIIVETGNQAHPFVAHTPTMRVPMPVAGTDNVYKAMRAMLIAVWNHNQHSKPRIRTVACPGLGTEAGRVMPHEAARQMAIAYRHFRKPPTALNWRVADRFQKAIGEGPGPG